MNKWWGYLHTDGSIHTKRYFGIRDIDEAVESTFVDRIYGPFEAENSDAARKRICERFRPKPAPEDAA